MAPTPLASLAPLPEEVLKPLDSLSHSVLRIGRWSSIESHMSFPSRMGSIDAATPSMLFPGTPTPMANGRTSGPFALEMDHLAFPAGSAPSCSSSYLASLTAASTAAPSTSSSASELPPSTTNARTVAAVAPQPTMQMQQQQQQQLADVLAWNGIGAQQTMAAQPLLSAPGNDMAVAAASNLWGFESPEYMNIYMNMPDQAAQQLAQQLQSGHLASLPSAGSALHAFGKCSPCAWFWKSKGCKGGMECTFCHLCPQDELKKRKRAKLAAIRNGVLEPTTRRGAQGVGPEERSHPQLKLSHALL